MSKGFPYSESFVFVISKWNKELKVSKFFYKNVPSFIAKSWLKERFARFARNLIGGFILLGLSLLNRNSIYYYEIVIGVIVLLLFGSGILYLKSKKLIDKEPLDTAQGVFLRLELKHNYTYKLAGLIVIFPSFFLIKLINIQFDFLPSIWLFITSIYFFDRLIWYKEYQQEKLFRVKFNSY